MLKILLFILSFVFIFTDIASSQSAQSDIGRYQLFQGTYKTFNIKTQQSDTSTGVFLIDTKTGEVKRYLNKIDEDGKYIETWVPTEIAPVTPSLPQPKAKVPQVAAPPAQLPSIYVIATKQSHIRAEADVKSRSLRIITEGTRMEKIGESGNMFKVKLPSGLIGWIDKSLVRQIVE